METRDYGKTETASTDGTGPRAEKEKALAYPIYLAYARWMRFEAPKTVAGILQKYGHRDKEIRTWLGERTPRKADRYLTDLEIEFLKGRVGRGKRAGAKARGASR